MGEHPSQYAVPFIHIVGWMWIPPLSILHITFSSYNLQPMIMSLRLLYLLCSPTTN